VLRTEVSRPGKEDLAVREREQVSMVTDGGYNGSAIERNTRKEMYV
jgi:hypothetical protein